MSDQGVEQQWETPRYDQLAKITTRHVAAMEASDADDVWNVSGMEHIVVHTVGRRSGTVHKVALATWRDPDGQRIVAGSSAGHDKHPAWFLNIRDRKTPEVLCHVKGTKFWSVPQILEGEEYNHVWNLLTQDRPFFNDYQAGLARKIPLVRLPVTRPAS